MALITCPGCSKQVSDDTESCPNCGNQIASAGEDKAAGVPLAAIKQKSRKLQFQYIISILLLIAGGVWIFVLVSSEEAVGKQDVFNVEPHTSFWQRLGISFLSILPIESQL